MDGNKRAKFFRNNKGITLIALIVTVVILLILVGTGLKVLVDDKAVNRAEDAVGKANNRVGIEQNILDEAMNEWDDLREGSCEHEWVWTTTKEATCTETGTIKGTCTKCGEVRTYTMDKISHIYGEWTITKEATCTETGTGTRTCTMCGISQTYEIAKVAHTYGAWTILTEATCTETGTKTGACTKCGQTRTQTIPAAGHVYEKVEGAGYRVTVDTEYSDGTNTAVIPAGFTVSGLATEQIIEDGLVVYLIPEGVTVDWTDGTEVATAQQTYDQFVWIPIEDINEMYMCQSEDGTKSCRITVQQVDGEEVAYCTTHKSTAMAGRLYALIDEGQNFDSSLTNQTYSNSEEAREPIGLASRQFADGHEDNLQPLRDILEANYWTASGFEDGLQTEYNEIVKSVYENGGFYIGRYETSNITTTDGDAIKVVAGATPAVSINWYYTYAQQKDYAVNKGVDVGSAMIQGAAYDQVMKFVNGAIDGNGNAYDVLTYSSERHTSTDVRTTAANLGDKVKNIYDLEGNTQVWTTEGYSDYSRVYRGGASIWSTEASDRNNTGHSFPTDEMWTTSSICQLYITGEIGNSTQLQTGACKVCGKACEHNYVNGTCSMCGAEQ